MSFQRDVHQILHIKGLRPEANGITDLIFARREDTESSQEGAPRKWGSGGNDCEHRRRQGAHRKRPPAILKVNCPKGAREGGLGHWLLSDRPESNTVSSPPRRAEPSQ